MSSFTTNTLQGDFFGGWQSDLANIIAVDTGTKKLNDTKINLLNKRYEEAMGYGLTGSLIDTYISKNSGTLNLGYIDKVSEAVAKAFRLNIEKAQALEIGKLRGKAEEKARKKWPWYYYAIVGGGMLTLIALSPTLNTFAKMVPTKRP
jgi:hypothetical protein